MCISMVLAIVVHRDHHRVNILLPSQAFLFFHCYYCVTGFVSLLTDDDSVMLNNVLQRFENH